MKEVILNKEQAVAIAITLLNGKKGRGDYGHSALKESELILKNILETAKVEKEFSSSSSNLQRNKTDTTTPPRTILDLENGYNEKNNSI